MVRLGVDNAVEEKLNKETRQVAQHALQDYKQVCAAIHYLETQIPRRPPLSEVAAAVNMSEINFQRLLQRWAGISPNQFLQYLTVGHIKKVLNESQSVLDRAFDVGVLGSGWLQDLLAPCETMTLSEYKKMADNLIIRYGFHPTPFGECLLFLTDSRICGLAFVEENRDVTLQNLGAQWSLAKHVYDQGATSPFVDQIFGEGLKQNSSLRLVLKGTSFQIRVWEALMHISLGHVMSYEALGTCLGKPKAARAIGSAVGQNPISYLVPCHRIIHKSGQVTGYRWGSFRKRAMLGWEAARYVDQVQHVV